MPTHRAESVRRTRPVVALAALLTAVAVPAGIVLLPGSASAGPTLATATLRGTDGAVVGTVGFRQVKSKTYVDVEIEQGLAAGFHGFHVHSNDAEGNGHGCATGGAKAFTAVDGHFVGGGGDHGTHDGDLPMLRIDEDGTTRMSFVANELSATEVAGRALVVHAGSDNYGNVPVSDEPEGYTPNGPDAESATLSSGNAGARVACGVIKKTPQATKGRR